MKAKEFIIESVKKNITFDVTSGPNQFELTIKLNGNPAGVYQYDARSGRSIAEIYPEFRSKGLGKILVLNAIYTAAKLGMDFVEDESRTSSFDNVMDSLESNGYIVNDDGYLYITQPGEQFLKGSLSESMIKIGAPSQRALAWIDKVYDLYPGTFRNNHVMTWGEGDNQQFAMFELVPSMSKKDAVEVKWFQAYPLRQGVGSRAMAELQRLAREDGIALTLYPWDKGQVSQAKLMKFYRGQGFKPTAKGSKNMSWEPELSEANLDANTLVDVYIRGIHKGIPISKLVTRNFPNRQIPALIQKLVDKYNINPNSVVYGPSQDLNKNIINETSNPSGNVLFLGPNAAVVGQKHGKPLKLSDQEKQKIQDIAKRHGAWFEGNGMDQEHTKGIIDQYQGSWDDDLLAPKIEGYPAPFLYVLFSNIKENNTIEKIGFDAESTIFDRILDSQPSVNYFPNRYFDADALRKFLQYVSEDSYDFIQMSQAPATESNVKRFFTLGEKLMWPKNWEEYPYKAGQVAKSVNNLRDKFLATRKQGVYVVGSDHLRSVQEFLNQNLDENFADGRNPGRKGLAKRMGVDCKQSVTKLRNIAKNSTGERQRMAHWCANMKSGKK